MQKAKKVLNHFGYKKRTIEEIRQFVGNGVAKLIERAIPDGNANPNFNECLDIFKKNYAQNMYNKTAPYTGILELLYELKKQNCKIAVVSNKFDIAVKELCNKYFPNLIDIAVGENEAEGIRKKPHPDTVLQVMEVFNANNLQTVYVGDSDVDILTAHNANLHCISVSWGFRTQEFLTEHKAEIIINSPAELLNHI